MVVRPANKKTKRKSKNNSSDDTIVTQGDELTSKEDKKSFMEKSSNRQPQKRGKKASSTTVKTVVETISSKIEDTSCVKEEETQRIVAKTGKKGPPVANKKSNVPKEAEAAVQRFLDKIEKTGVAGLQEEFLKLRTYTPEKLNYEAFKANKERNRYPDVVCLDETRVILQQNAPEETDFYHANWIKVEGMERKCIAAQGPMDNTIEDFWRMVFQETVVVVACICNFVENGSQKCSVYFPKEKGAYANYGKMFINNRRAETETNFNVYTLEVLPEGCSNSHITKLIQVTNWPDQGVPSSGRTVIKLIKMIKDADAGTCIVHCSAGIGRTGTLLAIDAVVSNLFKGKDVSVEEVFVQLRNCRASCIQTSAQYLFIYTTVLDYIKAKLPKHGPFVHKFYQDLNTAMS